MHGAAPQGPTQAVGQRKRVGPSGWDYKITEAQSDHSLSQPHRKARGWLEFCGWHEAVSLPTSVLSRAVLKEHLT